MLTETGSYALRWLTLGFATALVASQAIATAAASASFTPVTPATET